MLHLVCFLRVLTLIKRNCQNEVKSSHTQYIYRSMSSKEMLNLIGQENIDN